MCGDVWTQEVEDQRSEEGTTGAAAASASFFAL